LDKILRENEWQSTTTSQCPLIVKIEGIIFLKEFGVPKKRNDKENERKEIRKKN